MRGKFLGVQVSFEAKMEREGESRTVIEAAEWISKSQVANDIERGKVEPVHHVKLLVVLLHALEVCDELVYIMLQDWLLLRQCLLRERVRKSSALTGVVVVIGHGQGSNTSQWLYRSNVNGIFVHVCVADSVAVDIFPCLGAVEG